MPDHPIRDYRERHGMSQADLAAFLTEKLGRPVKTSRIVGMEDRDPRGRRIPKSYRAALGLPDPEPVASTLWTETDFDGFGSDPAEARGGRPDDPPMMPPGGRQAPTPSAGPGGDYTLVKDRISKAYNAIGAGVSMATRNDGYAKVTEAYSADLANAWAAAARENQNVARIVAFMESGGPVGELVVAHIILVLGFVYVSGRAPALQTIYGGKFAAYHNAAASSRAAAAEEGLFPGESATGSNGAQSPLGDARAVA